MIAMFLEASVLANIFAFVVALFQHLNIREKISIINSNNLMIENIKIRLSQAQSEIHRKETVILREKGKGAISVQFFVEDHIDKGLFVENHIIKYQSQIFLNGIPIGSPATIRQDVSRTVDRDQVNRILNDIAMPLIGNGISVAVKAITA